MKSTTLFFIFIFISSFSCNKKFDAPPEAQPVNLTPNISIKALKDMHSAGNFELINNDYVIEGTVIADDESGNFYKEIIIEDSTSGIVLSLNGYDLYTDYPVGRKVFIKAKGLYLGDYNGWIQLGGGVDSSGSKPSLAPLSDNLFDKYIFKGTLNNVVAPHVVDVSQLTSNMYDSLQSTLIQLDNFQFADADTAKSFADTVNNGTVNYLIKNCSSQSITLRNSGYADFAGLEIPDGNGSINCIYTVYGTTKELFIRDTSDVKFYGVRCDGSDPNAKILLRQDFSSVAKGSVVNLPNWQNVFEKGTKQFVGGNFSSNYYATISAYNANVDTVRTWLITPAINLDATTKETLSFATVDGYNNGATLKAYISTNYNGGSEPWNATWTQLSAVISTGHTSGYASAFLSSGNIDISSYSGNVYIAFVYEGEDPTTTANQHTTTYEIANVKVQGE